MTAAGHAAGKRPREVRTYAVRYEICRKVMSYEANL